MVLDVNGEPLVVRIEARAARHGPAFHDAIELKPQIVMQATRGVLLDDVSKAAAAGLCGRAAPT